MLVLEWKERAFIEKVNSRCFCWFPAAIYWCTKTVHQYGVSIQSSTKVRETFRQITQKLWATKTWDLKISLLCSISFSWLLPLHGFQFIFLVAWQWKRSIKSFVYYLCHDSHLVIDPNISPRTAGLHQVIVSIYWVGLSALPWLVVNGVSQTSLMVGGFWSKALLALIEEQTSLSNVQRKLCPIARGWWILLSG